MSFGLRPQHCVEDEVRNIRMGVPYGRGPIIGSDGEGDEVGAVGDGEGEEGVGFECLQLRGSGDASRDDVAEQEAAEGFQAACMGSADGGAVLLLEVCFPDFGEVLYEFPVDTFGGIGGEEVEDVFLACSFQVFH